MQNRRQALIDAVAQVVEQQNERPRDFEDLFGLAQDYLDSQSVLPMDDGLLNSCMVHAIAAPACDDDPQRTELIHEIVARLPFASKGRLASILKGLKGREN